VTARRIAVFTASLSYSVRKGIVAIDRAIPGLDWLVLLHAPPRTPRLLIRNQWRNLKRNGVRWIPYQARDLAARLAKGAADTPPGAVPGFAYTRGALEAMPNLRLLQVADIHGDDALAAVRAFAPDLGLSLAAPILRPALFSLPRLGTLNLHKGKVPDYRGMPPAFWELWNDEQEVGCTIHWVDERLDTGAIAAQASVPREKFSTPKGLQLRLDEVGVGLMRDAVRRVLDGERPAIAQPAGGRTYRKPTLADEAALSRRLAALEPARARGPRAFAKNAALSAAGIARRLGIMSARTPRITVLLYHRVSDEARDNLTVGVAQFDRQMALLRRHCRVLTLEDVLASTNVPRSPVPLVCVTFDDGYLDNALYAAPILERHGLPAAFFVSTRIVASDRRFPHDIRRENPPIPVMQWAHLRAMRDAGFTIGSHAATHIDCAAEAEDVVVRELAESRDDLAREFGVTAPIFAYPYGGRQHMTAQRLELVKAAGYVGCLSAYGGSNVGRVDRFNVLRRGIHWEFNDSAFLFTCMGFL
jgi:peptidoglycan/xylan/chitin deacetylase (PgdA/CDA1 family)